jgi:aminoglycoside/choline kinase family phosphotransferase
VTASEPRLEALRRFAAQALADDALSIQPASADASFRSYWRVRRRAPASDSREEDVRPDAPGAGRGIAAEPVAAEAGATYLVMDAPPEREDIAPWLDVCARLRAAGLHAPAVFAEDRAQGFVLIEDLGTRTYLPELNEASADALYADALDALARMQTAVHTTGLPAYDRGRLVAEMELMPKWLLARHFGFTPSCEEWDVIEAAFTFLVHAAQEQPRAFVHRDYHSRNLLVGRESNCGGRMPERTSAQPMARRASRRSGESMGNREPGEQADPNILASPGIIDFQDAVVGPITYDLVSLLRDCYIEWDAARVDGWMESHRERLRAAHRIGPEIDITRFRRWFDLMGVQRHVKVLGIFCRLHYRDGKTQYLGDLPLTWRYTLDVARRYPELVDFADLLERARGERDIAQPNPDGEPR